MYSMIGYEKCIYVTPCGYCSKFDKWCEYNKDKKRKEDDNKHEDCHKNKWEPSFAARMSMGG